MVGETVTNAVAEAAVEETVTEAAKQTWSIPELAVFGLAIIGAWHAGKTVAKGVKWCVNKGKNVIDQKKAAKPEEVEVEPVDIQDCKKVIEKNEKK